MGPGFSRWDNDDFNQNTHTSCRYDLANAKIELRGEIKNSVINLQQQIEQIITNKLTQLFNDPEFIDQLQWKLALWDKKEGLAPNAKTKT